MGKFSFLAGGAAGYFLGTRAGRQRYEQINARAGRRLSQSPAAQEAGRAEGREGRLGRRDIPTPTSATIGLT